MLCLGIETSCDETALALVDEGRLIDENLASQAELHAIFGGVVPELASREHYRIITALFDQLLQKNGIRASDIDIIAFARGPGLLGSLLVGASFAKGLSLGLDRPLLGINHLHAHLLAAGLDQPCVYPALGLVISGGHSNLYFIEGPDKFTQIGRSLDDAAGEAFDKTGNALGLKYPAGKNIDGLAQNGTPRPKLLPKPYLDNDNLDFSFSGLKTAAINYMASESFNKGDEQQLRDFCASFNYTVSAILTEKMERALARFPQARAIWVAGGVSANSACRASFAKLAQKHGKDLLLPRIGHCTDNAAMIAYAGWVLANAGYYHNLEVETVPRGSIIPEDMLRKNVPQSAPHF